MNRDEGIKIFEVLPPEKQALALEYFRLLRSGDKEAIKRFENTAYKQAHTPTKEH